MDIIDGKITCIEKYILNNNLLVDESYVFKSKDYISRLPNKHNIITVNKCEYKITGKSPVTLVLEMHNNVINNMYFMLTDKHGKYTIPDINNPFTKETIETFVNLL